MSQSLFALSQSNFGHSQSKFGHTLSDAQITGMLEPMPGTQVIVEYISDCSFSKLSKHYPPNSTVLLHNTCNSYIEILGEVRKLVVFENVGTIDLGKWDTHDKAFTEEVVIKSNNGNPGNNDVFNGIYINNKTKTIEIQHSNSRVYVAGSVTEHIDIKRND